MNHYITAVVEVFCLSHPRQYSPRQRKCCHQLLRDLGRLYLYCNKHGLMWCRR